MPFLKRLLRALPLLLLSPLLVAASALALAAADVLWRALHWGGRPGEPDLPPRPRPTAASVVIPNWNGRDLLEKYLPSVAAAMEGNPENEIVVVDNGSTDGSADFVRAAFPQVKLLALPANLGFGGGSNAGFRAARNDVVVLLNNDMRVDAGYLAPLLEGFDDPLVFAVSCQIFFGDPARVREETGLTQGWWQDGGLRVRHRIDEAIDGLFPCFYGGGGSCAFDRAKFLELGGFDRLLEPFYLEDTDLGYMAWKRGWKVLYQPRSAVYHEHRGTIGKRFREDRIQAVLKTNYLLFSWKNIHEWRKLAPHFAFSWAGAVLSVVFGEVQGRPNPAALGRAFLRLPRAVREFANDDLEWLIHRQLYTRQIDVLQLEYTPLAQYWGGYRRIATALFEHDIYFQSIARGLGHATSTVGGIKARIEYLRALRFELRALPVFDQVQVCTPANRDYLLGFLPRLGPRLRTGLRAGIVTSRYQFREEDREPLTMLFVGGFRHEPNRVAMEWFARQVLPLILARQPQARLVVAGSDPPPEHAYADLAANLDMLGYVDDVRGPLARYGVFVCPILSGSGVRVKLLEAFAAGIPVVSTTVGAEGLAAKDGDVCRLADSAGEFAERVLALWENPGEAARMARRARAEVEANWDMTAITGRLVESYGEVVREKRKGPEDSIGPRMNADERR
jgi:GT2 family glycosyltransferase